MKELKSVAAVTLYFACWFGGLLLLKSLILAEYNVAFRHFSMALIGALILAKVVLVLEWIPLGSWINARPAYVDVLVRTLLYSLGVVLVILLEKGIEGRHEYGGVLAAIAEYVQGRDTAHLWANTLSVSCAILIYNVLAVFRKQLGEGALLRMLTSPTGLSKQGKG